ERREQAAAARPLHDREREQVLQSAAGEHATIAGAALDDAATTARLRALHARGVARAWEVHVLALPLVVIVEAGDVRPHAVHRGKLEGRRRRRQTDEHRMHSPAGALDNPAQEQHAPLRQRLLQHAAPELEHADTYPHALVDRMRALGLFGALVPREYGGLGLDVTTYARVIEELCRGWMSLAGVINSHTMAALIVLHHGTEAQRRRLLPRFATGEARGGLCLTEPHAGSDV